MRLKYLDLLSEQVNTICQQIILKSKNESFHSYFSRLSAGKWYLLAHSIDPNILNAPKNKFITEENSEYHRNNIDNYPDHKKIMENWLTISTQRHIDFENSINVLKRHRLNF